MKFCILGDTGLLGQALVRYLASEGGHEILGISSHSFSFEDIPKNTLYRHSVLNLKSDRAKFLSQIDYFKPGVMINGVALTDIAQCEQDPALTELLNEELPAFLSAFAVQSGAKLVHLSSDQVFDGKKDSPYQETDIPHPVNQYGTSKLNSEQIVQKQCPEALIVRTNIVGWRGRQGKPTFAEWLVDAFQNQKAMTLFTDYVTSSIAATFLAPLIVKAAALDLQGIFHMASHDFASKYEFGKRLAGAAGFDFSKVTATKMAEAGMSPKRPEFLALNSSKAEAALGETFPNIEETINVLVRSLPQMTNQEMK